MTKINWISPDTELPPFGEKVLILTKRDVFVSVRVECAVDGNDILPYHWYGPGPFSFFAQHVTGWSSFE